LTLNVALTTVLRTNVLHCDTERLLLQQIQRLDTDHTVCSSTRSVLRRQD